MARPLREPDAPEIRPQVVFYFDVSCPYSYIASTRIDDVIRFTQANCVWRPVSQAGLYELDGNKLGRDGYPEGENIPEAKRVILARQFQNDLKCALSAFCALQTRLRVSLLFFADVTASPSNSTRTTLCHPPTPADCSAPFRPCTDPASPGRSTKPTLSTRPTSLPGRRSSGSRAGSRSRPRSSGSSWTRPCLRIKVGRTS